MYVFYDGNRIGRKFERLLSENNISSLQELSQSIANIHHEIIQNCPQLGAEILEAGGDEGLIRYYGKNPKQVADYIESAWLKHNLSATVGIGSTPSAAFYACKKSKGWK